MQEIKITRAQTLKEKPESSTLVFGKSMPRCFTMPRRSLRA